MREENNIAEVLKNHTIDLLKDYEGAPFITDPDGRLTNFGIKIEGLLLLSETEFQEVDFNMRSKQGLYQGINLFWAAWDIAIHVHSPQLLKKIFDLPSDKLQKLDFNAAPSDPEIGQGKSVLYLFDEYLAVIREKRGRSEQWIPEHQILSLILSLPKNTLVFSDAYPKAFLDWLITFLSIDSETGDLPDRKEYVDIFLFMLQLPDNIFKQFIAENEAFISGNPVIQALTSLRATMDNKSLTQEDMENAVRDILLIKAVIVKSNACYLLAEFLREQHSLICPELLEQITWQQPVLYVKANRNLAEYYFIKTDSAGAAREQSTSKKPSVNKRLSDLEMAMQYGMEAYFIDKKSDDLILIKKIACTYWATRAGNSGASRDLKKPNTEASELEEMLVGQKTKDAIPVIVKWVQSQRKLRIRDERIAELEKALQNTSDEIDGLKQKNPNEVPSNVVTALQTLHVAASSSSRSREKGVVGGVATIPLQNSSCQHRS